jgi:DNA-binding XRE family transcriptional regulator
MIGVVTKKRRNAVAKRKASNIRVLRERLKMPQRVFARLVGVSERSLIKYESRDEYGEAVERQVSSLARLEAALARVVKRESIGEWFQKPNPAFDNLKPLEVVERGEIDRLWAMIYQLESGTVS